MANIWGKDELIVMLLYSYQKGLASQRTIPLSVVIIQGAIAQTDCIEMSVSGTDDVGYMLLEDLEPDIVEDEMLDDIA